MIDLNGEAEGVAEFGEALDVGGSLVAEAEVLALVDLDGVEGVAEDALGEVAGRPLTELVGEGQYEDGVETGCAEQIEFDG